MLKNRVYILDYELISPIAVGADLIDASIRNNFSADRLIQKFESEGVPFRKAAEIQEDLTHLYSSESEVVKEVCKYDRKFELVAACYGKAANRLAEKIKLFNPERTGVILGVGTDVTPFELYEENIESYLEQNQNPISELFTRINDNNTRLNLSNNPYDAYAIYLANKFNAGAYQKSILTACVSSTQAIALGYDSIKQGEVDVVIAGGTDSLINLLATISFGKLGVIAETTDDVSCKPFDTSRNGTLAGECAGFTILVSEKFMKENHWIPVAELMGYGNSLDAYKITAPDPGGSSITKAIKDAVLNAGIDSSNIDYINAHGTGTKHNDQLELLCFEKALGPIAKSIPISSTKDRHGHAIAAAGIQEFCVLLELMKHNIIPANLNLKSPCETSFNLVRENTSAKIKYALTSNFAFGGVNTVLAIKNEMS